MERDKFFQGFHCIHKLSNLILNDEANKVMECEADKGCSTADSSLSDVSILAGHSVLGRTLRQNRTCLYLMP